VGLEVAGVDLLETSEGLFVLEVNASPGLQGIEAATGINVARALIDHAVQCARQRSRRGRAAVIG
jgi:ribosomal protein S6--L-glutamate ligase